MSAETQYLDLRGVTFAYSEEGVGPVVIRAHGLSSSRRGEDAAPLFDTTPVVDAGFRVIRYDARGHGESTGTTNSADYEWNNLADDLLALAAHFSPEKPVSIIGTSMGTATALHAVVKQPDRFDRLVLTAPPTAWESRAGQAAIYEQIATFVETNPPEALATLFAQAPSAPIFQDVPGFPPPPSVTHDLLPIVFRGAGASDLPHADLLRAVTQPTLLLPWATDPGHPVSTSERLKELIVDSEMSVAETSAEIATWGLQAAAFLR